MLTSRWLIQSTLIAERQDPSLSAEARLDEPLLVIDKAQAAADSFKESSRPHITDADVRLSSMQCIGSYKTLLFPAELSFQGLRCQQMW